MQPVNPPLDPDAYIEKCPHCGKLAPGIRRKMMAGHGGTVLLLFSLMCCKRMLSVQQWKMEEEKPDARSNA